MKKEDPLFLARHSLAHIMARVMRDIYPQAKMTIGPVIDNGFYYDFDMGDTKLAADDLKEIEKRMKFVIKQNKKFEKTTMPIDEALVKARKESNEYKLELITDLKAEGEKEVSYYTVDGFEDLCRGPHVESTKEINVSGFKLDKIAGAYWRGSEKNKMLTRIYGLAFNDRDELDKYIKDRKEMEDRNHRKIGQELELFAIFPEIGQGLPVWLPKGYAIRRTLEEYMIHFERRYGYQHILTPHINRKELFETSGHLSFYKESMYPPIKIDDEEYYLKPMNCPAGIIVYKYKPHSYRELPMKIGEFGTVYRYEKSGELHGLQRVRSFTQNDAHIYCTPEQLKDQFKEVIQMIEEFYKAVGFDKYTFRLSLSDPRSDKYVGDKKIWDISENAIRDVLTEGGYDFYEAPGEATFYGPKLDVQAVNVFGKEDSISTVQVDFNNPIRFGLSYIDKNGEKQTPVMIHRAILGSFERFFAFLIEHHAGKFPIWLAPVQVKIISVGEKHIPYCQGILQEFRNRDIRVDIDINDETVGNKIRKATKEKVPYVLVIGDKEMDSTNFSVRDRGDDQIREIDKEKFYGEIKKAIEDKE